VLVVRLSPRQVQTIGGFICGGDEAFEYRRMVDIEEFFVFTGAEPGPFDSGSRWQTACGFIDACQATSEQGASELPRAVEQVLVALLDPREFASDERHVLAVEKVNEALRGIPVAVRPATDGTPQVVSTRRTREQSLLDEQIHTVFGDALKDSQLRAAREHYAKAKRYIYGAEPDYPNAAKEAVCSIESLAVVLTGAADLPKALRKAANAGHIPQPIAEMVVKLYAYRGDEPGVSHGQAEIPDVTPQEAELILNVAGAVGNFLKWHFAAQAAASGAVSGVSRSRRGRGALSREPCHRLRPRTRGVSVAASLAAHSLDASRRQP